MEEGLGVPLRVAVAGRVKAGKSTLVNALLRRRVAPTDVGECTMVVTEFRYGNPERVDVHLRSGPIHRLPLESDGSLPRSLGSNPADVDHVTAWLSNRTLRHLSIIDTPGLSSARGDTSAATEQFLAIDRASRNAVGRADALVFVLTQMARQDELDALNAFRSEMGDIPATVVNAVAVLNKVDKLHPAAADPVTEARPAAERYRSRLRASVASVAPVVGLLAETAGAGVLTERDAQNLEQLAALDPSVRARLLLSSDRFTKMDCVVPEAERHRLMLHLDLFGVKAALALIDNGQAGAAALAERLSALSGVGVVRRMLEETFAGRADALKAEWGLDALERISYGPCTSSEDAAGTPQIIRAAVERVRLEPEMQHLKVIHVLQRCARGEVELPPTLLEELERLAVESSVAGRLGLEANTDSRTVKEAALLSAARWKSFETDSRNFGARSEVASVVRRSYEATWASASIGAAEGS